MKLLRIARGRWEVLVSMEPEGRCPVLDFLAEPGEGLRRASNFLGLFLRVYLPLEGPPLGRLPSCKPLGEGIFELRSRPETSALRVSLFNDGDRIVCTNAIAESGERGGAEVRTARDSKDRYFEAKSARRLEILEDTVGPRLQKPSQDPGPKTQGPLDTSLTGGLT